MGSSARRTITLSRWGSSGAARRVGIGSASGTRPFWPFASPKGHGVARKCWGHPNMKTRVVSSDTSQMAASDNMRTYQGRVAPQNCRGGQEASSSPSILWGNAQRLTSLDLAVGAFASCLCPLDARLRECQIKRCR